MSFKFGSGASLVLCEVKDTYRPIHGAEQRWWHSTACWEEVSNRVVYATRVKFSIRGWLS